MITRKSLQIISTLNSLVIDLPAFSSLTHFWNLGSTLGACLGIQIVTGIFLAIHYTCDIQLAFDSLSHIMRDVNNGWFIRIIHANGASLFFFSIYIHIGRGLYFSSFYLTLTWIIGVFIFLITILTAFLGYVLPWGQISYWGATVITNLLSAVPYIGHFLVEWLWGGFSVNNATLTRFFSLHYLFPFIIAVLVILHLIFLHNEKSRNPLGINASSDKIPFHPYFTIKDLIRLILILTLFSLINLLSPFLLIDPENFTPANPLRTPPHIQPEWYFLFAYAILRSIPNKLGGVLALIMSILILIPLTLKRKTFQNRKLNPSRKLIWPLIFCFLLLTWLGMIPVETPFPEISLLLTVLYFSFFIFLIL